MQSLDPRSAALVAIQQAYGARAAEYTDLFGSVDKASARDREAIAGWASTVVGPVLDAGCGPGHWSAFLRSLGLQVEGVDATDEFVQHAARTHPAIRFRLGDLRTLDLMPGSLGGILAWFSLIHLDPVEVPQVVRRLAAALQPGGTLLVGFFSGPGPEPFDHAVVTAWRWPTTTLEHLLEAAGLEVLARDERAQIGGRVLAEITARRPAAAGSVP